MPYPLSWFGRARRILVEQIERLRRTLEIMGQRLRESIAGEIGHAVAEAIREGVRALLDCERLPLPPRRSPSAPARPPSMWEDPYRPEWSDDPARPRCQEEWDEQPWNEPEEDTSTEPEEPAISRSKRILMLLCQTLLWWLRGGQDWPMMSASVLAGVAACVHQPLLTSAAAVFTMVSSLIVLTDTARSSAALLAEAAHR